MPNEIQAATASYGYNAQQVRNENSSKDKVETEQVAVKNQYKADGEEVKVKSYISNASETSGSAQASLSKSSILALQSVESEGSSKAPTPSEILRAYNAAGAESPSTDSGE